MEESSDPEGAQQFEVVFDEHEIALVGVDASQSEAVEGESIDELNDSETSGTESSKKKKDHEDVEPGSSQSPNVNLVVGAEEGQNNPGENESQDVGDGDRSGMEVIDVSPPKKKRKEKKPMEKKTDLNKKLREKFQNNCEGIIKRMNDVKEELSRHGRSAQMLFKSVYIAPSKKSQKTYQYKHGDDFVYPGDRQEMLSDERVKQAIAEAMKAVDSKLVPILKAVNTSPDKPSTSASVKTSGFSPQKYKRQLQSKSSDCCVICGHESVFVRYRKFESEWVQCSGDGKPCSSCAHVFCIGFPGTSKEEIEKKLPDYYCPDHREYGAALKNVQSEYTVIPTTAKSTSKGRGKRH